MTDKSTTGYQNSIVYSSASPSNLWKQTSATTKSPNANYYNQQNQQTVPQDPYQNEYQTSSQNPAILPSQTSSNQNHEYPSTPNYGSPSNNANYDGNSKQQIENSENDNYDRDYQMPANVEKTPLIASKSGSQEFPENQNDRRSQKTTTARFTTVRYFPTSRPDIANRFPLVNKPDLNPILSPVDKLVINVEYPTMNYANLECENFWEIAAIRLIINLFFRFSDHTCPFVEAKHQATVNPSES